MLIAKSLISDHRSTLAHTVYLLSFLCSNYTCTCVYRLHCIQSLGIVCLSCSWVVLRLKVVVHVYLSLGPPIWPGGHIRLYGKRPDQYKPYPICTCNKLDFFFFFSFPCSFTLRYNVSCGFAFATCTCVIESLLCLHV